MRVTREILVQLPQRTSDFVTTSGSIYLGRLAEWVGLTASEFSQATGQSVESVAKNFGKDPVGFRNGEARRVADELVEVVGLLQTLGMESDQAKRWLRTPNPAFDGRRPLT